MNRLSNHIGRRSQASLFSCVALAFCLVALTAGPARAALFSATAGADSYVRRGTATTNYGTATGVLAKNSGTGGTTRKSYVRFDLSGGTGVFTDATLDLDVATNNSAGVDIPVPVQVVNVYGLKDGNAGENWSEAGINWNNAPANVTGNNRMGPGAAYLGQFTVDTTVGSTVSFGTPSLASYLNGDTDGQATIMLTRENTQGSYNLGFASKEHATSSPITLSGERAPDTTAVSITTNDGNGADAYVRLGNPTTNYDGADLTVKNAGGGSTTRKGYLRFDLAALPAQAIDASIMFDVALNNQGGGGTTPQEYTVNVFGLDDAHAGENWVETGINWNNAPANGSNNGVTGDAALLGTFDVSDDAAGSSTLFSSPDLLDFINADTDGLATFILTRQVNNGSHNLIFASGEDGTLMAPTLTLGFSTAPVPEPATIAAGASVEVSNNHSAFDVSVFPGKAGYDDGVDSGDFGDGTVEDYRFFNSDGTTFNGTGYADGGAGLVSTATATNSSSMNGGALDWADVWTAGDPDADPADFTIDTFARSQGITGTVDISGLVSGQLYFIHGTFDNPSTVMLTMTGAGQPDLTAKYTENPGSVNKAWISEFLFANAALYDTISWTYTNTDIDASRARFMGVILDGTAPAAIPEPMTMLAVGLGISGLGGYIRKRRRA